MPPSLKARPNLGPPHPSHEGSEGERTGEAPGPASHALSQDFPMRIVQRSEREFVVVKVVLPFKLVAMVLRKKLSPQQTPNAPRSAAGADPSTTPARTTEPHTTAVPPSAAGCG
jgi:hypothetical protein